MTSQTQRPIQAVGHWTLQFILAVGLVSLPYLSARAEDAPKAPVPDLAAQEESLRQIKDIFKDDYEGAQSADAKVALAKKFLEQAATTQDDLPGKCTLISEARELAASVGDFKLAIEAADALAETFDVDSSQLKAEILTTASKLNRSANVDHKWLAETSVSLAEGAIEAENFAAAKQLASIALTSARKIRDNGLAKAATQRVSEIQSLEKALIAVKAARETLGDNPTDPTANLEVGRFQVLSRGDWEAGLPMLALGSDDALRDLAGKDLKNPEDPNEQLALADDWWTYSATGKVLSKDRSRERAIYWYRQALPNLTGLSRVKAEKRIGEAENQAARSGDEGGNRPMQRAKVAGKNSGPRIPHKVGEIWRVEGVRSTIGRISISPDGQTLLTSAGIWQTDIGQQLGKAISHAVGGYSADRKLAILLGHDGAALLRDVSTGQDIARLKGHTGRVMSADISKDGRRAITGGQDGNICLWDLRTSSEIRHFGGDTLEVWGIAFSPDGRLALSTARDQETYKTVRLWDITTGKEVRQFNTGHDFAYGDPVFSADGSLVAAANNSTAWVWKTATAELVGRFESKAKGGGGLGPQMVAFVGKGDRLLKAGSDRTIQLIATPSGEVLHTFEGHAGFVSNLAVLPGDRFFVSCSQEDDTIRLWGLPN